MVSKSLTDELAQTFAKVDELIELHNQALAYDQARGRTLYLHECFSQLHHELLALKTMSVLLDEVLEGTSWQETWWSTCRELKRRQPGAYDGLASALTTESLRLLQWVAYVAAAIELVQERHAQSRDSLLQRLRLEGVGEPGRQEITSSNRELRSALAWLARLQQGEDCTELHAQIRMLATRARGGSNYESPSS